jgi:uncharacterized protein YjbJ (UPF0337 family)/ElaB/YqjD/DUF883 family membrane-anchored ribosome-binding protein
MDSNRVEGNWKQIKGKAKEKWGKLTDDDLNVIQGHRDQLEGKIQERYGIAKDQVRRDVDDWYDSMKASGATGGNSPGVASATNSLARGKEAVGAAAADAMDQAAVDFKALRNDLNNLTDTVMKFISQAGNEAAKSAREITSNVAGQVGSVASDMVDKGASIASSTTHQAKTFAAELESIARRNPLGAIAGAVMVGVLIGMMGRRNG